MKEAANRKNKTVAFGVTKQRRVMTMGTKPSKTKHFYICLLTSPIPTHNPHSYSSTPQALIMKDYLTQNSKITPFKK
jgi:hypothetical protein